MLKNCTFLTRWLPLREGVRKHQMPEIMICLVRFIQTEETVELKEKKDHSQRKTLRGEKVSIIYYCIKTKIDDSLLHPQNTVTCFLVVFPHSTPCRVATRACAARNLPSWIIYLPELSSLHLQCLRLTDHMFPFRVYHFSCDLRASNRFLLRYHLIHCISIDITV